MVIFCSMPAVRPLQICWGTSHSSGIWTRDKSEFIVKVKQHTFTFFENICYQVDIGSKGCLQHFYSCLRGFLRHISLRLDPICALLLQRMNHLSPDDWARCLEAEL